MQTIWTVALALAAAIAGVWLWHVAVAPGAAGPQVLAVDFPAQIDADGNAVAGEVRFRAAGAPVVHAAFEVVAADFFNPFDFDLAPAERAGGAFAFYAATVVPQPVTLRVILTDAEGRTSAPHTFRFAAVPPPQA